ncbi:MAG: hypothetical protein BGO21_26350 [Dyadobacter sp. 50-39]|uniref:trypsin-like peptidase domain-containing protein n=1 Tax=Dyadobacter sp. 50-39 TaxID=1895756 RepID=UPI00095B6C11|nr:trypsin-like peptidase domain-containing protein [Dyadobacter sp. 50-39]OJV16421.1 MAG: hypothetical protein BGO21_26350 [Dyadobacter sp. 50-39]
MIIGNTSRLVDTTEFVKIMQHAASAVALIGMEKDGQKQGFCTGWLITPELVVVPDSAIPKNFKEPSYFCHFFSPEGPPIAFQAEPTRPPSIHNDPDELKKPLLLKLAGRAPGHVLRLEFQTVKENDQVLIFQYPQGLDKQQLSIGRVLNTGERNFQYSADTTSGSGGAPVINVTGAVIGMHIGSAPQNESQPYNANEGILLRQLITDLQNTPEWEAIAMFHKLVDTVSSSQPEGIAVAKKTDERFLIGAALQWRVDPGVLSSEQRDMLEPLVIDPDDEGEWIMEPEERRQIFRTAGNLQKLQESKSTGVDGDPMQVAIDQILDGEIDLNKLDEKVLPYWKQAVQWFPDVIPDLPTPEEIQQNLDKRRIRSSLSVIAGPDFRGREDDLKKLREWFQTAEAGPKMVSGIGGVGKSALIAKFVLDLPENNVIFWLDFDRPDLAPDDAVSVLRAISEQASLQIPGFRPPAFMRDNWQDSAAVLRQMIAAAVPETHIPLMILDGFEVAQHARRYQEIWAVLNILMQELPSLHVIVSGRAPVSGLELNGRAEGEHIHLSGMDQESAKEWLKSNGITDEAVIQQILAVSGAVPLILKLAVELVRKGGGLSDIPVELPQSMIEGYLYKRILNRIVNPQLKEIAEDVLVLRTLQPTMLHSVLHDRMRSDVSEDTLFEQLKREMGLVYAETEGVSALTGERQLLHVRPEVRGTTLFLLEKKDPDRVHVIHQRAIEWYQQRTLTYPREIAELIYHYLCIGNVTDAQRRWQDACAHYLNEAVAEIPERFGEAREWLGNMLEKQRTPDKQLTEWEREAVERIRGAISRKLYRIIPGTLKEEAKRSLQSPLTIYDAWVMWRSGNPAEALRMLDEAPFVAGPVGKGRKFLAAAIAAHTGDTGRADDILLALEGNSVKTAQMLSVEQMLIHAARIRLSVDIANEISIYNQLQPIFAKDPDIKHKLRQILSSQDVMIPHFSGFLSGEFGSETQGEQPFVPENRRDSQQVCKWLNDRRGELIGRFDPLVKDTYIPPALREQLQELLNDIPDSISLVEQIVQMVKSGCKKWHLAMQGLYLKQAFELAGNQELSGRAIYHTDTTIAALRGQKISYHKGERIYYSIDEYLDREKRRIPPGTLVSGKTLDLIKDLLQSKWLSGKVNSSILSMLDLSFDDDEVVVESRLYKMLAGLVDKSLRSVLLYLLSPDPLDVLYKSYLEFPVDVKSPEF